MSIARGVDSRTAIVDKRSQSQENDEAAIVMVCLGSYSVRGIEAFHVNSQVENGSSANRRNHDRHSSSPPP
jgi:hypothetical protein